MFVFLTVNAQKVNFILGISGSFGSHRDKIGLFGRFDIILNHLQIGSYIKMTYNKRFLSPPLSGKELQFKVYSGLGFGQRSVENSFFVSLIGNFTGYKYFMGYVLSFYIDDIETSQRTGGIIFQANKLQIYFENDILAQHSDKYRTGALILSYFDSSYVYRQKLLIWTPDPKGVQAVYDSLYPSRFGYKDLTTQKYGKYSLGILAFDVFYDRFNFSLGIDSEWVRYWFQNKLIHDMIFLPRSLANPINKHYPMVSRDGSAYLFRPGQKVRPSKIYIEFGVYGDLSY